MFEFVFINETREKLIKLGYGRWFWPLIALACILNAADAVLTYLVLLSGGVEKNFIFFQWLFTVTSPFIGIIIVLIVKMFAILCVLLGFNYSTKEYNEKCARWCLAFMVAWILFFASCIVYDAAYFL